MKFLPNLPAWERLVRLLLGVGMIIAAVMVMKPGLIAYGVEATGGVLILTSLIAFCPMCAMAGRKPCQTCQKEGQ